MLKYLIAVAMLGCSLPAQAGLTFFWRCEGTTLDGTDDFTVGDNTATATGTADATAMRVGTNGCLVDAISEDFRFDNSTTPIVPVAEGSMGFWLQFPSALPGDGSQIYTARAAAAATDALQIRYDVANDLDWRIANTAAGAIVLPTTGGQVTTGTWYFIIVRWDDAANDRRIEIYNTSMSLIDSAEDLATDFTPPGTLNHTSFPRMGDISAQDVDIYFDNVFISDNYSEPIEDNATITSFTQYDDGTGGGTVINPICGGGGAAAVPIC